MRLIEYLDDIRFKSRFDDSYIYILENLGPEKYVLSFVETD